VTQVCAVKMMMTRMKDATADAGDSVSAHLVASVSSSWCEWHSCRVRSSRGTSAYAAPSPCEPSRSTWPALTDPMHATDNQTHTRFMVIFQLPELAGCTHNSQ